MIRTPSVIFRQGRRALWRVTFDVIAWRFSGPADDGFHYVERRQRVTSSPS
jgi:hypothetical protein